MVMEKNETMPKEFWDDMDWGRNHFSELMKDYPDMWIAIVNKKVVSAGKDLGKVIEEAKWKTKRKHIPVKFIDCGAHLYGWK